MIENVRHAIWACENILELKSEEYIQKNYKKIKQNLDHISETFCGSWLGYHSSIYYRDFQIPKPGVRFDSEWGLRDRYGGYTVSANWIEYPRKIVREKAMTDIDPNYLKRAQTLSDQAKDAFDEYHEDIVTLVEALLKEEDNSSLQRLKQELQKIEGYLSNGEIIRAMRPRRTLMSRDSIAFSQGLIDPEHCVLQAEQIAIFSPFSALEKLAKCSRKIVKCMEIHSMVKTNQPVNGKKVFIGHGRSHLWRELKDFLEDRLHLEWEEFNREPAPGITTSDRLQQMLDASCFAFLIMTGEDLHTDDQSFHARENVIHEVGLFQGRLGFHRAIILLEDGCTKFSNIQGLTHISFQQGSISATFEDIRRVLEREKIVQNSK